MITQETRNAVADYLQSTDDDGHTYDAFRRGQCDNHPLMLAFESYGIAAEQAVFDAISKLHNDGQDITGLLVRNELKAEVRAILEETP